MLLNSIKPISKMSRQALNTKYQKLTPGIITGSGNRKKKISSKLEFDNCIFNKPVEQSPDQEKKKKVFSAFGKYQYHPGLIKS